MTKKLPRLLVGEKFNMLTVVSAPFKKSSSLFYELICECGGKAIATQNSLKSDNIKSCGCNKNNTLLRRGLSLTKGYGNWAAMVSRCNNEKNASYKNYGGRGIRVCERWMSVVNFIEDMGQPEKGMQLDRIDNEKGYSKENCRWVTAKENCRNRRNGIFVIFDGEKIHIKDLAEKLKVNYRTMLWRHKNNKKLF